jgi:drug/metabolite transporter (DMT)-like permease
MLVGLQPILTVFLARAWLGERISALQWCGLVLGLAGVYLVVRHKIALSGEWTALVAVLVALIGISVGTLYQKKYCAHVDLRSGAVIQFAACALLYAPLVAVLEPQPIAFTPQFLFALGWSVIVLSVGAISLLYWLLRHGAAADVARLFYLVPPVTALMAFILFGERLDTLALAGMVLIAIAVALARRRPA